MITRYLDSWGFRWVLVCGFEGLRYWEVSRPHMLSGKDNNLYE